MNDGSIRISTKIETKQAEADLGKLAKKIEKTADKIAEVGKKASTTFTGMSAKQLQSALEKANGELEKMLELQNNLAAEGDAVQRSYNSMYANTTSEKQREFIDEIATDELGPINQKWEEANERVKELQKNIASMEAELQRIQFAEVDGARAAEEAEKDKAKAAREYAKAEKDAEVASKQTSAALTKGFTRGIKKAGRLVLSILSIRSAFAVLRRAASAYLDSNEELKNQINSIWNVLGTAIGPVVEKIVGWLTTAITYINALVLALTGIDFVAKANAAALKKQTDATKKAVAASKTLAGFDEITKISGNSSISGTESGGVSGVFQQADIDLSKVEQFAQIIKDIAPLIAGITSGILTWSILDSFGASLKTCAAWALVISGAVTTIDGYIDAWENGLDWKNLASTIAGIALAVLGLSLALGLVSGAIGAIAGGVGLVVLGFKDWFDNGKSVESLTAIETGLLGIGGAFSILAGGWIPLVAAAIAGLFTAFLMYGNEIHSWLTNAGNEITNFFGRIAEKTREFFSGIGKWLEKGGAICHILSAALTAVGDVVGTVMQTIGGAFGSILKIIGAVVKTISAIGTGDWAAVWEAWKDAFLSIWNAILNFLKGVVNVFIDIINTLIRGLNKISVDIPDWVPGMGGRHFGINITEIPRLATGGIVNRPGRGVPLIAGEAGAEAILPLDQNTGWMDMLAEKINGATGKIVIPIYLSGKKIAEEVIDLSNKRKFVTNGGI